MTSNVSFASTWPGNGAKPENPLLSTPPIASAISSTRNGSAPDGSPMDPRFGYHHIRYHAGDKERDMCVWRQDFSWAHCRPNSVLITAMGYHWKPGCWQRVMDMVHYTNSQGYFVAFEELMDRCFQPYDALGAMRNEAIFRGQQGYEWLLYIDNDILPQPDTLVRLIERDESIIAPYILEPGTNKPLHGPIRSPYSGLQKIRWCVLSMLLFRTSVFNCTSDEFWNSAMGADEGYHFQKLWRYGHRPRLDTDLMVSVASTPTYPLATNRMEKQNADAFWGKRKDWLLAVPDRRPVNPSDPRVQNGEYFPFVVPSQDGKNPDGTSNSVQPGHVQNAMRPGLPI